MWVSKLEPGGEGQKQIKKVEIKKKKALGNASRRLERLWSETWVNEVNQQG